MQPAELASLVTGIVAIRFECRATKFAPTWTSQGGKPNEKTLLFRHFLVSKFAPTWTSQGGKLGIQRLRRFRKFQNPSPFDTFAWNS